MALQTPISLVSVYVEAPQGTLYFGTHPLLLLFILLCCLADRSQHEDASSCARARVVSLRLLEAREGASLYSPHDRVSDLCWGLLDH